jgi:hypothetical protein
VPFWHKIDAEASVRRNLTMPDIDQLLERQEQRLLPVLEYWAAGGKHPGSIQVEFRSSSANDGVIHRHSTCGLDKSEVAPAIADYAGPLLVRLPPSPFRSLGGYFNYEGWPDQQRFMELDGALRLKARENLQIWSKTNSSAPKADSGVELEHGGEEVGQRAYCSSRGVNVRYR